MSTKTVGQQAQEYAENEIMRTGTIYIAPNCNLDVLELAFIQGHSSRGDEVERLQSQVKMLEEALQLISDGEDSEPWRSSADALTRLAQMRSQDGGEKV